MSIFDSREFNERLFFPRPDASAPPPGAVDTFVDGLHVRTHGNGLPTLLLFHGNGEVVADYDDQAAHFAAAGASLAVMDYRGYGRSEGSPTLRGIIDDATKICAEIKPAIVMGRSLGSACAAELYARGAAPAFVIESGFVDLVALILRRGLPPQRLTADELAAFDPLPKLARGTAPLLVLHGARDELIDPDEARRAHDAAGTRDKRLVYIANRGHNDLSFAREYWDALAKFVGGLS